MTRKALLVTLPCFVTCIAFAATAGAQDAAVEATLIANERAINEAVMKGDASAFSKWVAADSWTIDPMAGRASTADFLKAIPSMATDMKVASWDITDPKSFWIDANTVVVTYKWTGSGTYKGQPIPSPVWCSTVWAKKDGKWSARFHQETLVMPGM